MNRRDIKKLSFADKVRRRILLVGMGLSVCFCIVAWRAVQLQVLDTRGLSARASRQVERSFHSEPNRGSIFDSQYTELAATAEVTSVGAYPRRIKDIRGAANRLAKALRISSSSVFSTLSSKSKYVWIKRHAAPREVLAVRELKIDGIDFVIERKRFYPLGSLAAQLIGFCGTDGRGLEGLEYQYDRFLRGDEGVEKVLRDAKGRAFSVNVEQDRVQDGYDLVLTVDQNIQDIAEQALVSGVEEFGARSGIALVMAPRTGAILAMAHAPQFNPNAFREYPSWVRRNRAIADSFEPGSTFKILLASAALESGLMTPETRFNCENGQYRVGRNVIHDVHGHDQLTFTEIVKYSSNIGAAKIGQKIGAVHFYNQLRRFGIGNRTGVDCPGETRGLLSSVSTWTDIDATAICFGQGVSVSALQMAAVVSALANDGIMMKPYLVQTMRDKSGKLIKNFSPQQGLRVVGVNTARDMMRVLEGVVSKTGTGSGAALSGYQVAGKTGTAQKVDPATRKYFQNKYVASFVGVAPSTNPEIVVMVVVDEPTKSIFGGVVAAPIFRKIAQETLAYLKVPPEIFFPDGTIDGIQAATALSAKAERSRIHDARTAVDRT